MLQTAPLFALLSASLAAAQMPTIEGFLLRGQKGNYVGSIVSVHNSLTTVVVKCQDEKDCNWVYHGATLTQNESTVAMQYSKSKDDSEASSQHATCQINQSQNAAKCAETLAQTSKTTKSTTHIEVIQTGYSQAVMPIVITAGADKLPKDATGVVTSSGPKETSSSTATKANAAPAITGNAVLAGAAAIAGYFAL